MKKTLMMMAIAACAVSAQAVNATAYIRIYKGTADRSLSEVDIGDTPSLSSVAAGTYIVKEGSSIDGWKGVTVSSHDLSEGYKVYFISDTKATPAELYSTIVDYLSDASYYGFANKYKASYVNDGGENNPKNQMFYASLSSKEVLELNVNTDYAENSVAVFTYINKDGSAAQYNVIAYDKIEGTRAYFDGSARNTVDDGSTGWQNFASIPEPTSGMLMLLGLAGLCLRRKQK